MCRRLVVSVVVVAGLAFLAGCAKAPEAEVAAAKQALEAARVAEADKYAKGELGLAQDALAAAEAEIQKQNSANPIARNYTRAKELLNTVTTQAAAAQTGAVKAKEAMKVQVENDLLQARTALTDTRNLLGTAPKGKEGRAAIEAMKQELAVAESTIAEAEAATASGDYAGAHDKLTAASQEIGSIKTEVEAAIAKAR